MNPLPDPFNNGSPSNPLSDRGERIPTSERMEAASQQAKKWFAILLVVGLGLGGLLSVGVVKVLTQLGLTQKPAGRLELELPEPGVGEPRGR